MARVTRVCDAGVNARKRPDMLPAPSGGVSCDVRRVATRGFRRRKERAEVPRMLARRRVRKRWMSRWNKRIEDSERDKRKIGKRGVDGRALRFLLSSGQYVDVSG